MPRYIVINEVDKTIHRRLRFPGATLLDHIAAGRAQVVQITDDGLQARMVASDGSTYGEGTINLPAMKAALTSDYTVISRTELADKYTMLAPDDTP
jgi:hypothetical protein